MEMDAAVGVASLVIQLCDIFVRIYGKYCDQKDLLIQASDAELDKELEELRHSAVILRKPPDLPEGRNSDAIMQLQEAIMGISRSTCAAVDKFSKILDEIRPKTGQSRVECLFKASKSIFFTNKFESINAEIKALRRRTDFLMASLINEKSTLSLELQAKILDVQKEQSTLSLQTRDEIVGIFSIEFESIRKLIVQLKSGRSTAIDSSLPWLQHANSEQNSIPVTSFQSMGNDDGVQSRVQNLPRIIDTARQYLDYSRMSERERLIKNAHSASFHWIFQDRKPDFTTEAFASFPVWLEHGHGCYWIQGKAGAGKSTLMKRIHLHEDTRKHLKRWSGNAEVQIASYFFWYLGSTLQKTLEGMIRALLYTLLEKSPQYVITILPELFVEAAKLDQGVNLSPPSLEQLLQWFSQLAKACETSQAFKVCFFVDGLDECSGDKEELVKFFLSHGEKYKNTKFVLASRPLPVFSDAFSQLPGLRVQDLTRDDIMDYTHTLLSRRAWTVDEEEVSRVTELISSRSQGVFLWVAVVVQSVLEGLRNGDDVGELQQRIQELPEELTDLYKRMLEAIDERYRPQAAAMLLLVSTNVDPVHPRQNHALIEPLSAVQFSFAERGCENAMKAPVEPCTAEELKERVVKLEPRLRSRCLGLLELEFHPTHGGMKQALADSDQRLLGMAVVPFHRTAVEFLVDEEVSTYLREQAGKEFDPFSVLFCSCISMVKIASSLFSHPPIKSPVEHSIWTYILFVYCICYEAERRGAPIEKRFMDEFDRAMNIQWKHTADSPIPRRHENVRWLPAMLCNKAETKNPLSEALLSEVKSLGRDLDDEMFDQLESHYQQIGFIRIVSLFLRLDDMGTFISDRSPVSAGDATVFLRLLIQTRVSARNFGKSQLYFDQPLAEAIGAMLQAGADPNAADTEDHNLTLWTRFLVSIFHFLTAPRQWMLCDGLAGDYVESIIQNFISHGADLSALVPINDDLAMPSLFMHTMHLLSVEGESLFSQRDETLIKAKYTAFKDSSLRIARILREREERAGLHSLKHRAARSIRQRWKSRRFATSSTRTR